MKTALVTGCNGQDGSYLAELLLEKGYVVHGTIRRSSQYPDSIKNIEHIKDRLNLHFVDLINDQPISNLINEIKPDEIYHLAAQSDVRISFDIPEYTCEATAFSTLRLLEAVRHFSPNSKVYFASSTETFGSSSSPPQNENTPMIPRSPYGAAKLFAYNICQIYRDSYRVFISCGILGNHESARRGLNFVTRKITHSVAEIAKGKREFITLGNLDAKRDWGYSGDYVQAMFLMLQQDQPDNFAVGTGEAHTIRDFLEETFKVAGIKNPYKHIIIDSSLFRPAEVNFLQVDASKAERVLGWKPKVLFKELVKIMYESDYKSIL